MVISCDRRALSFLEAAKREIHTADDMSERAFTNASDAKAIIVR